MTLDGFLDRCDDDLIGGWVYDRDDPTRRLELAIFAGPQQIGRSTADLFRGDLLAAGKGDGHCAFQLTPERGNLAGPLTVRVMGTDLFFAQARQGLTAQALPLHARAAPPRFRRCILHIGTEKTGSTSLQMFLYDNREALAKAGYFVPTSLNRPSGRDRGNSWLLAAYARDDTVFDDAMRAEAAVTDAAGLTRFRAGIAAALADEIAAAPADCHTMILSNEHCHSALPRRHEVAALRHLLDPFCAAYRVLVYMRAQAELAVSAHAMMLKNRRMDAVVLPRFDHPTPNDWAPFSYFDYDALLSRWSGVFGPAQIEARRYVRSALRNGDVIDDVLDWLGLPDTGFKRPGRVNPSLSAPAQHFLVGLTQALQGLAPGDAQWVRQWVVPRLVVSSPGRGMLPARADVAAFMAQFEASNEAVRSRWFPGLARLFELDLESFPERVPPTPDVPAEFYREVIRMLLVERDLVERARHGLPSR